ncbi:MAG: methyltransferase family protein [Geminicoccaceae bacterium]
MRKRGRTLGLNRPTWFIIWAAGMLLLHIALPLVQLFGDVVAFLGAALICVSAGVVVWADQLFSKVGASLKPSEMPHTLVTDGPYTRSRNPMYAGMVSILVGFALILGSLSPLIAAAAFGWFLQTRFISTEEDRLTRAFGNHYRDYASKVRRWI